MELFKYYNLDECSNFEIVEDKLVELEEEGKIEYKLDDYILKIEDLELSDNEIEKLSKLFDDNDILPYIDYEEYDDSDDDYFDNFSDDEWED
jgi:hypothetical protein